MVRLSELAVVGVCEVQALPNGLGQEASAIQACRPVRKILTEETALREVRQSGAVEGFVCEVEIDETGEALSTAIGNVGFFDGGVENP